ncbi:MAG: NADH-quinone oxidoreductase subunit J [Proteobacteria bacterium]|nr:NADH-quinone oxidoreductase subunit J [Pseudomonadota bacterium]MBU1716187.1 NADH-quinone oxidoreductase subunit J [Pseudomonadota bacterium]
MSLPTPEDLAGLIFLGIVAVTVTGGIIAVNAARLIRAVTGLVICFIGVAGLYYYLNSPFLALMEMLIYVGAVCVTIVFAIMLAEPEPEKQVGKQNAIAGIISLCVGAVLFWSLAVLGTEKAMWPAASVKINDGSILDIGQSLLKNYSMAFELISIVLLMAIIGALVLARAGRVKS